MIVEIIEIPRRRFKTLTKKIVRARCDACSNVFEFAYTKRRINVANTFCSYACMSASKKGGVFQVHLKQKMLDKYGVENPSQVVEVIQKRTQTFITRFGCNPLQLPRIRRITESRKIRQKAFDSQRRNGTLKTSAPENKFYEWLCTIFSADDISRWVRINRWNIDFYVKPIDAYIQFDGIFWHGLDRPIEEIRQSFRPVDKQICLKWETDQRQNEWFEQNNFRLIRVTDREFSSGDKELLKKRLQSQ